MIIEYVRNLSNRLISFFTSDSSEVPQDIKDFVGGRIIRRGPIFGDYNANFFEEFYVESQYNGSENDFIKILEENPKYINYKNSEGTTILMFAAAQGKLEIVEHLLEQKDIQVNVWDSNQHSALLLACYKAWRDCREDQQKRAEDLIKIVKLLVQKGANPDYSAGLLGNTFIPEFFKKLTKPTKPSSKRFSFLVQLPPFWYPSVAEIMYKISPVVSPVVSPVLSSLGLSDVDLSHVGWPLSTVKGEIIQERDKIQRYINDGIHIFVSDQKTREKEQRAKGELINLLKSYPACINQKNAQGESILMLAIQREDWAIVHYLLDQDTIDVHACVAGNYYSDQSALSYAVGKYKGYREIYDAAQSPTTNKPDQMENPEQKLIELQKVIQKLHEKGAKPDQRIGVLGATFIPNLFESFFKIKSVRFFWSPKMLDEGLLASYRQALNQAIKEESSVKAEKSSDSMITTTPQQLLVHSADNQSNTDGLGVSSSSCDLSKTDANKNQQNK